MLQNIKELYGHKLAALDGDIGHVKDFYFDDTTWAVRYLVADTGSWLTERLVPLTHHALGDHAFGRTSCGIRDPSGRKKPPHARVWSIKPSKAASS